MAYHISKINVTNNREQPLISVLLLPTIMFETSASMTATSVPSPAPFFPRFRIEAEEAAELVKEETVSQYGYMRCLPVLRSDRFWFDDGTVVLQVGRHCFA